MHYILTVKFRMPVTETGGIVFNTGIFLQIGSVYSLIGLAILGFAVHVELLRVDMNEVDSAKLRSETSSS